MTRNKTREIDSLTSSLKELKEKLRQKLAEAHTSSEELLKTVKQYNGKKSQISNQGI